MAATETIDAVLNVNLRGALLSAREAVRRMSRSLGGSGGLAGGNFVVVGVSQANVRKLTQEYLDALAAVPGVQAFTWESSGGHSILNAANFQVRRRLAGGFSGDVSYTLAKSMDNASSLGAGAPVVSTRSRSGRRRPASLRRG